MFDLNGVAEILVPLAAIICIFGLPVTAFVIFRLLSHRERMEMIRNGMMPGGPVAKEWRASARPEKRRSGCGSDQPGDHNPQSTLRKGISLAFIGFAITLGLSFIGYDDNKWSFGPWLLGGLIPMFVGLAQVTIALLSGATLGSAQRTEGPYYGGMPPQAPSGAVPDFDSPYTYRPGPTQELRPPASPPERKS